MVDKKSQDLILQGRVAGIINARELTINIGLKDSVKKGMEFKVLAESPLEINDPETGDLLGKIDREKVRVKTSEVYEKFSICRTFRTYTVGGINLSQSMIDALLGQRREVVETLKAEDSALPPPLSEEESYVKRGDRVILVEDN